MALPSGLLCGTKALARLPSGCGFQAVGLIFASSSTCCFTGPRAGQASTLWHRVAARRMVSMVPLVLTSISMGFPVAQAIKNLPEMQETQVRSLGREGPLEK